METTPYHEYVKRLEGGLAPYSKKSFEDDAVFLNGQEMLPHFQNLWKSQNGQLKLGNRTPLQLERDRILYSSALRKQTEKYHVLHSGFRRVIRNYTTHTMRMAHVTRAICKALGLNSDFAEAVALGAKVGAAPFIHVSKAVTSEWLRNRIVEINNADPNKPAEEKRIKEAQLNLFPDAARADLPSWLGNIKSKSILERVSKYVPCAIGEGVDTPYSSGQESYWLLCTDPYLREPGRSFYSPETMYGIWRHTRGTIPGENSFYHRCAFGSTVHQITWHHPTYESIVVQYADDMTWIIENLNDASDAALLDGKNRKLFFEVKNYISPEAPMELKQALVDADAGALYTYFITDFVQASRLVLDRGSNDLRIQLRRGDKEFFIGPSGEAEGCLDSIAEYLRSNVFEESRVKNRNKMLKSISQVSLDLLYDKRESILAKFVEERANLESWAPDKRNQATDLLSDDVHRAQLAVDIFSAMGDQEIFDFVGIQSF